MISAILENRKSQTRRVMKPQPKHVQTLRNGVVEASNDDGDYAAKCPYGQPGDRLWVRENFRLPKSLDAMNCTQVAERMLDLGYTAPWAPIRYEADGATINATDSPLSLWGGDWGRLRVARFMPRWASRLALEITDVRVQRVQEISEEDAKAEGVIERNKMFRAHADAPDFLSARQAFLHLFYDINKRAPKGSNPWVWVITFKRVES